MEKKHYSIAVDFLRVLAILAVVLIHTTVTTIQTSKHTITAIPLTFFLNQIAIFAVPLFFLISGFVLELNYKQLNYFSYFQKRASKVVIPYIFWSLFYYLAYPATISKNASFFSLLLTGKAAYQLYFIPAIIILYLLFPLLHRYYLFFANKIILTMLFLAEVFFLTQDYFYGPFSIGNALRITLLSFVMFPLGMIASHHEKRVLSFTKKYFSILLSATLLTMFAVFAQGWYLYTTTRYPQAIYSQYQPLVLPYTLLIAAIFFPYFSMHDIYKKIIMRLSRLSFFVFFIHVAIIYTFWDWIIEPVFHLSRETLLTQLGFDVFFFVFVAGISFLIADLLHRIPKLSKLTG